MKIFISWSGERSRLLADALRQWLPGVINAAEPWISSSDIEPGARWGPELARHLEQTKYGILCLTAENLNAPWLLFEAGALSKFVDDSRVVPLILDLKPTDIKGPLSQFQGVQARDTEINTLIHRINKAVFDSGEKGVDQSVIDNSFKLWWPRLKEAIENIPTSTTDVQARERPERDIVEEILTIVRLLEKRLPEMNVSQYWELLLQSPSVKNIQSSQLEHLLKRIFDLPISSAKSDEINSIVERLRAERDFADNP